MGRSSDKRRSARRPGRCERARVKSRNRAQAWFHVRGVGRVCVKAGQKKFGRVYSFLCSVTLKSVASAKRPLYKVEAPDTCIYETIP